MAPSFSVDVGHDALQVPFHRNMSLVHSVQMDGLSAQKLQLTVSSHRSQTPESLAGLRYPGSRATIELIVYMVTFGVYEQSGTQP